MVTKKRFSFNAIKAIAFIISIALLGTVAQITAAQEEESVGEVGLEFYIAPLRVVKGEKVQLDWESEGAEYCTASGLWSGQQETSGSLALKTKKTGNYQLQCFDDEGLATEKIVRNVTVVTSKKKLKRKKFQKPTPTLSAPATAGNEQEVSISWSTPQGTVACRASGPEDWEGLKAPDGKVSVSVEVGKEYSLSCWNNNGEKGAKVTHRFKQKPTRYTASDAKLSSVYLPLWPDDLPLADGTSVYVIDFVRKEENSFETIEDDVFYFGARIVIDPVTNIRITDSAVLRQLNALPSQVPLDVDPSTKRITVQDPIYYTADPDGSNGSYKYAYDDLNRFINDGEYSNNGEIPTLTPDTLDALAVDATLEYLELPKDDLYRTFYTPSTSVIWFNGTVAGTPMYFIVDVYNKEGEKIHQVVLDPYTGADVTKKEIFEHNRIWDRTILEPRDSVTAPQKNLEPVIKDQPVSNPPTQTPVVPSSEPVKVEPVKVEPKKEESAPSTTCPLGSTYSTILAKCYEDGAAVKQEEKPTCPAGQSYSTTLKQCFKD